MTKAKCVELAIGQRIEAGDEMISLPEGGWRPVHPSYVGMAVSLTDLPVRRRMTEASEGNKVPHCTAEIVDCTARLARVMDEFWMLEGSHKQMIADWFVSAYGAPKEKHES